MYKYLIVVSILSVFLNGVGLSQENNQTPLPGMRGIASSLPDISVIGDIDGKLSTNENDPNRNKVFVREVEFALQGYLYPEIRTDIFFSFHREKTGKVNSELEEAYVSFLQLFSDFNGKVGKMLVDFGKINKLHSEQLQYVDKPGVLTNFLGEHGLIGSGGSSGYLLPLSFFSQIDISAWRIEASEEPEKFSLADIVYVIRLWNSFSLTDISEFEIGGSGAMGKGYKYLEYQDDVKLYGIDLTYKLWPDTYKRLIFQNEVLYIIRTIPADELKRYGFYNYLGYQFNKYWVIGGRYDFSDNVLVNNEKTNSISAIFANRLTESTMLRLQYTYGLETKSHDIFLQFIFGIGPHSHPLQ